MAANSLMRTFHRVRMNIDQNLGRAEKSEVLNEEEQNVEKRVELLKNVCQNFHKKIVAILRSHSTASDVEKRLKKLPESSLSLCLIESSLQFGQDTGTGQVFHMYGESEGELAAIVLAMEMEIEQRIVAPVRDMVEVDYPSIVKLKKQLSSRTVDLHAAKSRCMSVQKQSQSQSGLQAKLEEAKAELDDAHAKMEQTRDQLTTEMYNFVSKESDISRYLQELARIQIDCYRQSLSILERLIPQIQENIDLIDRKPLFGQSLQEHLESENREIAYVIEECVTVLSESALKEEGLFRIAGPAAKVKELKTAFNSPNRPVINNDEDIDFHVIAGVLKLYLRELPEPLMGANLYGDWIQAYQKPVDQRLSALQDVVNQMPKANYDNLRFLIKFLAELSEYSEVNKMSPSNIGIVLAPNLLWAEADLGSNVVMAGIQSSIVELLVVNADVIFSGSGTPLSSITNTALVDGGGGIQASVECRSTMDNDQSRITTSEITCDSSSAIASAGSFKVGKTPKKLHSFLPPPPPPPPAPPGGKQPIAPENILSPLDFDQPLSSGVGHASGEENGDVSLPPSLPPQSSPPPSLPPQSLPPQSLPPQSLPESASGETSSKTASAGPRQERPKLPPPPGRPQVPPPEKPTSAKMPSLPKDVPPPTTNTTTSEDPELQNNSIATVKPVLVDTVDECNLTNDSSLPDAEKEPSAHQAPTTTVDTTQQGFARQPSYPKKPPRPKPPSPPRRP